jgi:hypothetical protein
LFTPNISIIKPDDIIIGFGMAEPVNSFRVAARVFVISLSISPNWLKLLVRDSNSHYYPMVAQGPP